MNSGSTNSGVFIGVPDPNSPGGTKDAGKGSGGKTESGKVRQGGEPDSGRNESSGSSVGKPSATASSSDSSSGGDASESTSNRRDSGKASDDMKADQVSQSQGDQGGNKQINKGMKKGEFDRALFLHRRVSISSSSSREASSKSPDFAQNVRSAQAIRKSLIAASFSSNSSSIRSSC